MKKSWIIGCVFAIMTVPILKSDGLISSHPGKNLHADLLKGLGAFYVVIEDLSPIAEEAGVKEAELKVVVEKAAGRLGVLLDESAERPFLFVNIQVLKVETDRTATPLGYAASVSVELKEWTTLSRKPEMRVAVSTWDKTGALVLAPPDRFKEEVEKVLDMAVSRFLSEYQSANPS